MFEKGGKPALVVSTLEALAVLVSLKASHGSEAPEHGTKVTWTDNRGNGSALNKMMTTRFPASAVLMELSEHMRGMSQKVLVEWTPREGNQEADRLANGDATGFSNSNEVKLGPGHMNWLILDEALELGRHRCLKGKRKRPEDRLKLADPW